MDSAPLIARTNLRSWSRRFRRGRLEPLDATASRVLAQIRTTIDRWPTVSSAPAQPVLVQDGIPVIYLVAMIDFWTMAQRTDLGPRGPATLYVMVHRHTLADPWECTCTVVVDRKMVVEPQPIRHPEWCDPDRCTATPAAATGETHRGAPTTITVDGFYRLAVTASLHKPHAPWLTEVYVDLDVSGLTDDWTPVRGNATVPAHRMAEIGQALVDLAARGSADQQREIDEHLARLRAEVAR